MCVRRVVLLWLVSTALSLLWACGRPPAQPPANPTAQAPSVSEALRGSGIEVDGVRLTAADYFLDFRYRITDPELAARVAGPRAALYLIDEASGARLTVPSPAKIGRLASNGTNPLRRGKTYFALFANPGRLVKRGSRVTVAMGGYRAQHLIVQ